MAIPINDNIYSYTPKHLDARYGPYDTVSQALEMVPDHYRVRGLTVGIIIEGNIIEYWFMDGVGDANLIKKEYTRMYYNEDIRAIMYNKNVT
jgi:hypothetical protein